MDPWGGEYVPPSPSYDRPRGPRPGGGFGGGGGGGGYAAPSGPETQAKVKWFNAEKGFGFVELTDGSGEAFIHIRAVEASGRTSLKPGSTLTVRVGQGQKGPQVTELLDVDESTAEPERPRGGMGGGMGGGGMGGGGFRKPFDRDRPPARPTGPVNFGEAPEGVGTVKWYDPTKGFGFVSVDGVEGDLFVHRSAVERSGVGALAEGQRVRFTIVDGRKGKEVGAIAIA